MKKSASSQNERRSGPGAAGGVYRIVIIDDHALVRNGLADLLTSRPHLAIAASVESAAEGIEAVRKHQPDLVIVDLSLSRSDGLELVKQCKCDAPRMPVLVISMHDETVYADRALRAGARGYIMKKESSERILQAVDQVLRGEICVSGSVQSDMLKASCGSKVPSVRSDGALDRLSDRELQVFRLLGNGLTTKRIAEDLHLSVKTIESYRENLKVKLNLKDGPALIQRAVQWCRKQPDIA